MVREQNQMPDNMISLAERLIYSDSFKPLYQEGMSMVEEAAAYLDGEGRQAALLLPQDAAILYSSEAMRLTTRLMQLASWLLLQRATRSGEMSPQLIATEKAKVNLDTPSENESAEAWNDLPEAFKDLVQRSMRLQARIRRMEYEVFTGNSKKHSVLNANPVSDQLTQLQKAFRAS